MFRLFFDLLYINKKFRPILEVCTGRIFRALALSEVQKKISVWARSEREIEILFESGPAEKRNWNIGPSTATPKQNIKF